MAMALLAVAHARRDAGDFRGADGVRRSWRFAYTRGGVFAANFTFTPPLLAACFRLRFCAVPVARDALARLRVAADEHPDLACEGYSKCEVLSLRPRVSHHPSPDAESVVVTSLIGCELCLRRLGITQRGSYVVVMRNEDAAFPRLGWDEAAYPIPATIFLALAIGTWLASIFGFGAVGWRGFRLPVAAWLACVALLCKVVVYALYCGAFWDGVKPWFPVVVVPFEAVTELLVGALVLVMSTAVGLIPDSWKVDRNGAKLAFWVGMAIVGLDVVLTYTWDVARYYGFNVFHVAVAGIALLHCRRNARFFDKFAELVDDAKIDVESTPLLRVLRFFWCNGALIVAALIVELVALNLVRVRRPDVRWVVKESLDMLLLLWYVACVWPRVGSAYYVDMSNVNNIRLKEVNMWRWRLEGQWEDGASVELGERVSVIGWNSGDPLPVPNTSLWALQQELQRREALARVQRFGEG